MTVQRIPRLCLDTVRVGRRKQNRSGSDGIEVESPSTFNRSLPLPFFIRRPLNNRVPAYQRSLPLPFCTPHPLNNRVPATIGRYRSRSVFVDPLNNRVPAYQRSLPLPFCISRPTE